MSKTLITILGLLALAILGYFCIYQHSSDIQNDVYNRTSEIISKHNLDGFSIGITGRDIVLTGVVASDAIRQQAVELAREVHGVRTVDNQLSIVSSATEPSSKPKPEAISESEPALTPESELITEQDNIIATAPPVENSAEDTCQRDFNSLLDNNQISFATNSADIDSSSNNLLHSLIDTAKLCTEANIEISGHTDSRGNDDYNLKLSQARASSVMNYLINNGIESNRLSAVGYGETKPIADNESEEGLAKNRRIEFNVKGLSQ